MRNIRIVVLQRGFVLVGLVKYDGTELVISRPSIVRKWGTPGKGLGYLADNGPQAGTVLDAGSGDVRVERLAVLFQWECGSVWMKHFGL